MAEERENALTGIPWFLRAVPRPRSHTVARPRLTELLRRATGRLPLVIVAAPSGFGKTVALADWVNQEHPDALWLTAVASADDEILIESISSLVLAHAPDSSQALTIVIDDAHLLDPGVLRNRVASDPMLQSGGFRIVLAGQPELVDGFSRAVASGLAEVIGAQELSMELSEIEELLRADAPLRESPREIPRDSPHESLAAEILAETGGWPIAVQLQSLAHEDRPRHSDARLGSAMPQSLGPYIEQVVLAGIREDLVGFILAATTCRLLDEHLARTVTGREEAGALLEECRSAGLFLESYIDDRQRVVYRWHDAFAAQCRKIFRQRDPEAAMSCEIAAARALATTFPSEAAAHALRVQEIGLAVSILRRGWLGLLLGGHARTLESLCQQLPPAQRGSREMLAIRACCRDLLGDQAGAALLRRRAGAQRPGEPGSFVLAFSEVLLAADAESKARATDAALSLLAEAKPEDDYPHGLFLLGWSELRLRRDPEQAVSMLDAARAEAEALGLETLAAHATMNGIFSKTYAGRFEESITQLAAVSPELIPEAGDWDSYDGGVTSLTLAYGEFWKGDFDRARRLTLQEIERGGSDTSFLGLCHIYYALSVSALRDGEEIGTAKSILRRVSDADKHGVPWGAYKRIALARLLQLEGSEDHALQVAAPLLNHRGIPVTHAFLAEFYRATENWSSVHLALQHIEPKACPPYARAVALATLATLDRRAGRNERAYRRLETALDLTAAERVDYPFLAVDGAFISLMRSHLEQGSAHEQRIVAILARPQAEAAPGFTAREREILEYLRTRMTAQEIGEALFVSAATVRSHIQAVYRKLGVSSRRDAVRRLDGAAEPSGRR